MCSQTGLSRWGNAALLAEERHASADALSPSGRPGNAPCALRSPIISFDVHGFRSALRRLRRCCDRTLDTPIALGFTGYLATASLRGYAEGWPEAIAKAVLLIGWLAVCLTIYRFILFFTTFYAT